MDVGECHKLPTGFEDGECGVHQFVLELFGEDGPRESGDDRVDLFDTFLLTDVLDVFDTVFVDLDAWELFSQLFHQLAVELDGEVPCTFPRFFNLFEDVSCHDTSSGSVLNDCVHIVPVNAIDHGLAQHIGAGCDGSSRFGLRNERKKELHEVFDLFYRHSLPTFRKCRVFTSMVYPVKTVQPIVGVGVYHISPKKPFTPSRACVFSFFSISQLFVYDVNFFIHVMVYRFVFLFDLYNGLLTASPEKWT